MLNKIKHRPLWYKVWAIVTALAAFYILIRVIKYWIGDGGISGKLTSSDFLIMIYVHISLLLDFYFFPEKKEEVLD